MPPANKEKTVKKTDGVKSSSQREDGRSTLFVGSVEKTFNVLAAFDTGTRSLSLTQIAETSGLNLSAAQRFVYTLQSLGFLRKDLQTRQYSLSPKLLNVGTSFLRSEDLAGRAVPYIRQASDQSGETISLLELDGADVIHVIRYGAARLVNMRILLGTRMPALLGAGGRVILASLPTAEAEAVIEQAFDVASRHETLDRTAVEESLNAARRDGFLVVNNAAIASDLTVAAPVIGARRHAIASVEFTVPPDRWSDTSFRDGLIRLVIETAQALSTSP